MNILVRQLCIVITFSSPPLLSQYKVHRTDPLASISSSLQLFSLQAEDGTTATLKCPRQTKVGFTSYLHFLSLLTSNISLLTSHFHISHLTIISHISLLYLTSHFHISHLTFISHISLLYLTSHISLLYLTSHFYISHLTFISHISLLTSAASLTYICQAFCLP